MMNRCPLYYVVLPLLLFLGSTHAFAAYDIALQNADGKTIYYKLNVDNKIATVTHPNNTNCVGCTYTHYSGVIAIPEKIEFENEEYTVTSIDDLAFNGCANVSVVNIPNSVTSIGRNAFYGCSGLNSITIPDGVTRIEKFTFFGCASLTEFTIPQNVKSIGWSAFNSCSNLSSLTIPNSVTKIEEHAFQGCTGLTSVDIPNSVTIIEAGAFYGCGLTSIIIPESVTNIPTETFGYCASLTSVSIPHSVTNIGNWAFQNCTELTSVKIPKGVTSIGQKAFAGCSKLSELYCYAKNVPTTYGDAFDDSNVESVTLHIPAGTVSKYKAKAPWNRFKNFSEIPNYALTYMVDGVAYKSYREEEGNYITAEPAPTKEGYTFSGWSEIPITMPAHDVVVTGTFVKDTREKCATPTIKVENGILKFECATEGVDFHYTIQSSETQTTTSGTYNKANDSGIDGIVLPYATISVYASKSGYNLSDTATLTVKLSNGKFGDLTGDGVVNVADHVELSKIIMDTK